MDKERRANERGMMPRRGRRHALSRLSPHRLLVLYADVMRELRRRRVVRSSNNPVADLAERVGAAAFQLRLQGKATAGYDGKTRAGVRYQIKARRVTPENGSKQLSAIRGLGERKFDYLLAIFFDERFEVQEAYRIRPRVVSKHARWSDHVHAHLLVVRDAVVRESGVQDVTARVQKAMKALNQRLASDVSGHDAD